MSHTRQVDWTFRINDDLMLDCPTGAGLNNSSEEPGDFAGFKNRFQGSRSVSKRDGGLVKVTRLILGN